MASPTDTGKLTVLGVGVYSTLIKGVSQNLQHFFWYPLQTGHQWLVYKKKFKVIDRSNIVVMFLDFGNHRRGQSGWPPKTSHRRVGFLVQKTELLKLLCGVIRGSHRPAIISTTFGWCPFLMRSRGLTKKMGENCNWLLVVKTRRHFLKLLCAVIRGSHRPAWIRTSLSSYIFALGQGGFQKNWEKSSTCFRCKNQEVVTYPSVKLCWLAACVLKRS